MPFLHSPHDNALLHYLDYSPHTYSSNTTTTNDDAMSFQKPALIFLHGWPMSSLMFEHLLLPLSADHGFRCIASDRRGFGKSEWTGDKVVEGQGKDGGKIGYEVFVKDTIALIEMLEPQLKHGFVFVGASMGCNESLLVCHKLTSELKSQCHGFIWLGASLPYPLATPSNPTAPSRDLWDYLLAAFRADRTAFAREGLKGVFGTNMDIGIDLPGTVMERFEGIVAAADVVAIQACIGAITGRDLTEEVKELGGEGKKVLLLHGTHDQGMPVGCSSEKIKELIPHAELKVVERAAHGLYLTHQDLVLNEILTFVSGL